MLGDPAHGQYSHDIPERPLTMSKEPVGDGAGPAVRFKEYNYIREEEWNVEVAPTTRGDGGRRETPVSPARAALEDVLQRQREARGGESDEDVVPDLPLSRR
eukprot:gene6931-17802_t